MPRGTGAPLSGTCRAGWRASCPAGSAPAGSGLAVFGMVFSLKSCRCGRCRVATVPGVVVVGSSVSGRQVASRSQLLGDQPDRRPARQAASRPGRPAGQGFKPASRPGRCPAGQVFMSSGSRTGWPAGLGQPAGGPAGRGQPAARSCRVVDFGISGDHSPDTSPRSCRDPTV